MASDAENPKTFEYFAFISYSRKDSRVARWLQRKLEWYRFPTDLVAKEHHPPHPTHLRPIVRDKTDLDVDSKSFWENIEGRVSRSRFLIVLCSPSSAKSEYVSREIRHFLQNCGRPDAIEYIVPVIVEGNPGAGDDTECLPAALREVSDQILTRNLPTMIPDAGEREAHGWETGFVQAVAYLLHVDRAKIADRYQRAKRRQIERILVGACVALVTFAAITTWAISAERRARAERNRAVAARNDAEDLSNFMIFDLRDKLQPVGQVRVLYDSVRKVQDYYRRNAPDESNLEQIGRYAGMYEGLGDALALMGQRSEAEECYRQSLDIMRRAAAKDSPDWLQHDLAVGLEKMGDARLAAGDRQSALNDYRESLDIMRKLAEATKDNSAWQRAVTISLNKVGDVLRAAGDRAAALRTTAKVSTSAAD